MANTKQVGFRFDDELVGRLDAYAESLRQQTGLQVSRADAARVAVDRGLTELGFPKPGKTPTNKGSPKPKPKKRQG